MSTAAAAKDAVKAALPPLLLGLLLACIALLPTVNELLPSSVSPDLPLGFSMPGWYGVKTQESDMEREALAADTVFSKAVYREDVGNKPDINVSVVYSGNDMNNSIHRPERCLPAQGHQDLRASVRRVTLSNGRELSFTRLSSFVPSKSATAKRVRFTHYYIFIGHGTICHNHLERTVRDMYDRVVSGAVERWAYLQVGTCWGEEMGISEEEADHRICHLLSDLLPDLVNWQEIQE